MARAALTLLLVCLCLGSALAAPLHRRMLLQQGDVAQAVLQHSLNGQLAEETSAALAATASLLAQVLSEASLHVEVGGWIGVAIVASVGVCSGLERRLAPAGVTVFPPLLVQDIMQQWSAHLPANGRN